MKVEKCCSTVYTRTSFVMYLLAIREKIYKLK